MEQESRVNNPKPWIAQLFCRHHGEWFRRQVSRMKMLRKQGFTIREIAEKMDRSESSIKYKLYGREKSDGRS